MGAAKRVTSALAVLTPALLVAGALALPVRTSVSPASGPPQWAAGRAEREIPPLALVWGKVRSWRRVGEGWTITWQPAHGSWLLRAWVPDAPEDVEWRLDVAPWLPGPRLSRRAAELLVGDRGRPAVAWEKIGRRDWTFGRQRLLGALPAGDSLPAAPPAGGVPLGALLAGCLLAGAVTRVVFPGIVAVGWRHAVVWTCLAVAAVSPWLTPFAARSFESGVRPWITELTAVASAGLVLGALGIAAIRFPVKSGRPPAPAIAVALAAGLLAGRLAPATWLAEIAGVQVRLVAWSGVAILGGWLSGLAGEGLREILEPRPTLRTWLLAACAAVVVPIAGPWLGAVVAVILAAGVDRGHGTWVAAAGVTGWVAGGALSSCGWWSAQRDALILLGGAVAVLAVLAVGELRRTTASAAPQL
jgi:hypothetical protein